MEGVDQTTGEIAGDWVAVRWPEDGTQLIFAAEQHRHVF